MATFTRRIEVDWGITGVAADLSYTIYDGSDDDVATGSAGITEVPSGSGIYRVNVTWDTAWTSPMVVWSDGTYYAAESMPVVNVIRANGSELEPRSSVPGSVLTIIAPVDVNDDDRLNLVQGDDHASGDRVPTWTIEDYAGPSLSGSTGKLRLLGANDYEKLGANATAVLEVSATVSQVSTTVTVTAAITSAQSALLASYPPGDETTHQYQLVATTSGGSVVTLKLGPVTVKRRINAAS